MTAPTSPKGELNWLLDDLVDRIASIRKALVLSGDGLATGASKDLSREDSDRAALLIRTAVGLAPNDAESQLFLGFALVRYGQDAEALTALERYRTLNPQGRDADDTITAIRARQNQNDPALSVYAANCASCHGASGGGGIGPSLRASTLSRAAIQGIIRNGQGAMPAFPSITGTKLTALTDLLEKWQGEGQ